MPPIPAQILAMRAPIAVGLALVASATIGLVWISIAVVESAAAMLGPVWAPASVGLVLLAPLAIFATISWRNDRRRQAAPILGVAGNDAALSAIAAAAHKMIDKSPLAALALATLAGVVATRYPAGLTLLANVLAAAEKP
jgi:hypothetical protein